ncbi:MAG TPA: hypothetical protein VHC49_03945 [Mycobacteriales bacterium]|nr:hypothetical protein [Mycobacteriales bacterium]
MRRLRRALPFGVIAALILAVAVIWHPGSSGAAATYSNVTHQVSFTGDGPSPATIRIADGDSIDFSNDVDPSARVPVIGLVTGVLADVSVTISGATVGDFTLDRAQSGTAGPYHTGGTERTVPYTVTYTSRYVVGLLPGPSRTLHGTIVIEPPAS